MTRCMLCALQKNGKKNASEQHSREKVSQGYSGHGAQVRAAYASRSGQFFCFRVHWLDPGTDYDLLPETLHVETLRYRYMIQPSIGRSIRSLKKSDVRCSLLFMRSAMVR